MATLQTQNESAEIKLGNLQLEMCILKGEIDVLKAQFPDLSSSPSSSFSPSSSSSSGCRLSHPIRKLDGSNGLHIAAGAGQLDIMSLIISHAPGLLNQPNKNGDLPIHLALKTGQKYAVRRLLEEVEPGAGTSIDQLNIQNKDGNTALHIALQNQFEELADILFDKCHETFNCFNKEQICPLHLAIKAGYENLAIKMIPNGESKNEPENPLKNRSSVVHAAIMARNEKILARLIDKYPELRYSIDKEGRTALSYAAEIGFLDGVTYLLNTHPELACQDDEDGSYPIHKACSNGSKDVIKEFLKRCPSMKFSLNKKNRNIFHIAAQSGRDDIVKFLLGQQWDETKELINLQDDKGNTPLHLATKGKHPDVVFTLIMDARVKPEYQNKKGDTALDLIEKDYREEPSLDERLTWTALLLYANVPRSKAIPTETPTKSKKNKYKGRFNTLLVVCTLIATVTFSATFTIPGGYISSQQNEGMATLAHRCAFKAFVFSNTTAMFSSMFSAVVLIWAHLDDIELSLLSLDFALPFMGLAIAMMSVAFMTGFFVVLHNMCEGLAIMVLILGGIFLAAILAFFIPLYSPTSQIKNKFARFIFQGIFKLMLLASSRSRMSRKNYV